MDAARPAATAAPGLTDGALNRGRGRGPRRLPRLLEIATCMATPAEVLARPGLVEKIEKARAAPIPPMSAPGPDREKLLALLAA